MSEFNFESGVCTSIEQSKRLIALGLKKTTADCVWIEMSKGDWRVDANGWKEYYSIIEEGIVPAWSLYRLWELLGKIKKYEGEDELLYPRISLVDDDVIFESPKSIWARRNFCSPKGAYENIINCFEDLIKEEYFNKEYLNGDN